MYVHRSLNGDPMDTPVGKVVCVGRNYHAHVKELNNTVPKKPLLFMKPSNAMVPFSDPISFPAELGACHYETEIALLIGRAVYPRDLQSDNFDFKRHIAGVGVAIDLTLRDLQTAFKKKGYPWELAKAFDGACPLTSFVPLDEIESLGDLTVKLKINGELVQKGSVSDMMTSMEALIQYIATYFTLNAGDVVLTGTPEGVGPLESEQVLKAFLYCGNDELLSAQTTVL